MSGVGGIFDQIQYHDLWCYLGTCDPRITRAYPDTNAFDLALGVCALVEPDVGTAWVHTDGTMTVAGNPVIGDQLAALVQQWDTAGRPRVCDWSFYWRGTHGDADSMGLLRPHRWQPGHASANIHQPDVRRSHA